MANSARYRNSLANLCIVIPARNEEETILQVIQDIRAVTSDANIVVVDDDSSDNTVAICRKLHVITIPLVVRLGAWGATQAGMRYAFKSGFDYVVTMDADGQHEAAYLHSLIQPVTEGRADVTIGACVQRGSRLRKLAWQLMRGLSGLTWEDITSGYRAYNRQALEVLISREATLLDYQDVGVLVLLKSADIQIEEVTIEMPARSAGSSRIFYSWMSVIYYMCYTAILGLSKRS